MRAYFSDFFIKHMLLLVLILIAMTCRLPRLVEDIQMSTNNMCFDKEVDAWPVI